MPTTIAAMPDAPELLTMRQTADTLGLSPRTVARLTRTRSIPSIKLGQLRRYPREAIRLWIARGCPVSPGDGEQLLHEMSMGAAR